MKKQIKILGTSRLFLVLAFLLATTIASSSLISSTYADQLDYSVSIPAILDLVIPSNAINLHLNPGNATFDDEDFPVTIRTNNEYGYYLSLSSTSTDLVDTTDSTKTMPTLTEQSGGYTESTFTANRWGYKVGSNNYNAFVSGVTLLESNAPTNGAWYNYVAATAGTITGEGNSTNATKDICPKGWRLPTNDEFSGITSSASTFSPTTGGFYNIGSLFRTSHGSWWSATSYDVTFRYGLYYDGSSLSTFSNSRVRGFYVRCIKS